MCAPLSHGERTGREIKVKATPAAPSKPVPSPPREASPELDGDDDDDDIESREPAAPYVSGELGRSSPMRYVHGAPLHNVLEEGEEEVEE